MPPMTSSRPGARAIAICAPGSKSRSMRSRSTNRDRSALALMLIDREPAARSQLLLQQRFHRRADLLVRVADPRHVGIDAQRRIERTTRRVGHDDTALFRNQRATDVVRM